MKKNLVTIKKGIDTDSSIQEQPKDTYRYALNAVNETELGDIFINSNEGSNEITCELKSSLGEDLIPLGQVSVGDNNIVIFSTTSDETISEIGIFNGHTYKTLVNADLNFKVSNQIDATFRLRQGCERTIYWVDNLNKPRQCDIDNLDNYKTNGTWDINKFNLIRTYSSIPKFKSITVQNTDGALSPGSYNIAIQYLDESLNPTDWITTSEIINIYNSDLSTEYRDITGSTGLETTYEDFPKTTKSIDIVLSNLDSSFLYYRLAFIESTGGLGQITSVKYSAKIPTTKTTYTYTGLNFESLGSETEVLMVQNTIESADSIEQVENRLVLANTKGPQINFCELQKYASKIRADVVTKKVSLSSLEAGNSKSPTQHMESVGFMPGEIYSFGIVYVFTDGTTSPVYHIPGKAHDTVGEAFTSNSYPMSIDNSSENSTYTDNDENYWGVDSSNVALKNTPVRHHRFPTRKELGLKLLEKTEVSSESTFYTHITFETWDEIGSYFDYKIDVNGVQTVRNDFNIKFKYTVDGEEHTLYKTFFMEDYESEVNSDGKCKVDFSIETPDYAGDIVFTEYQEMDNDGVYQTVNISNEEEKTPLGFHILNTTYSHRSGQSDNKYTTDILGIKFSDISVPESTLLNGKTLEGYYIVQNERTQEEKTILDSGVLFPTIKNNKYIGAGLLGTEVMEGTEVPTDVFGFINPEFKFNDVKSKNFSIIQEGKFNIVERKKSKSRYLDVLDGTSYDSDHMRYGDGDGWSLKAITRDNIVEYESGGNDFDISTNEIDDIFYLNALQSKEFKGEDSTDLNSSRSIYNITGDNKIGILKLKEENASRELRSTLPYVYFKKDIKDSYSNFRNLAYYKISPNIETGETTTIFNGDTYITPMRYLHTIFWENRIAERVLKDEWWKKVLGVVIIAVGAVITYFSGGAGAPIVVAGIGLTTAGAGVLLTASGISSDNWNDAYSSAYNDGLKDTLLDSWIDEQYLYSYGKVSGPQDDEIQWIGDCITDLWFESSVNMSLRTGFTSDLPTFMNAPGIIEDGNTKREEYNYHTHNVKDVWYQKDISLPPTSILDKHVMKKLTAFNDERKDGKEYLGHVYGELYKLNPDYSRKNTQKLFYHLALEYSCSSKCKECYPHRVMYSEQSYQEELIDNFKTFLPNNYKDIEGDTGKITDLFRLNSNLYIHTEEALWFLPQNHQERVSGEIISYIGTGDFFNLPPQKIKDSNLYSGGTQHKWATLKTEFGVFFFSEREHTAYLFDGKQLTSLSNTGVSDWFKQNGYLQLKRDLNKISPTIYTDTNNTSNALGIGYTSTYDSQLDRLLLTKKDYHLNENLNLTEDDKVINYDNKSILFRDYLNTIETEANKSAAWVFDGFDKGRMKFHNSAPRIIETTVTTKTDIVVQLGENPYYTFKNMETIIEYISNWFDYYKSNNDFVGNLIFYLDSELYRCWNLLDKVLNHPENLYTRDLVPHTETLNTNIVGITFTNESAYYQNYEEYDIDGKAVTHVPINVPDPSLNFLADFETHKNTYNTFTESGRVFKGFAFPIVPGAIGSMTFLQHAMEVVNTDIPNFSNSDIGGIDPINWGGDTAMEETFPYSLSSAGHNALYTEGLDQYGWTLNYKQYWANLNDNLTYEEVKDNWKNLSSPPITEEILGEEFQDYLEYISQDLISSTTTSKMEIEVSYKYIDGEEIQLFSSSNSWTRSFSMKSGAWVSFHSYIPNIYFKTSQGFYSWIDSLSNIYKHNLVGNYGEFYGKQYPYIIEFAVVAIPPTYNPYASKTDKEVAPVVTKIWEGFSLNLEAREYSEDNADVEDFYERVDKSFDQVLIYNRAQCSGYMNIVNMDEVSRDSYMQQQLYNIPDTIKTKRVDRDWMFNNLRDLRADNKQPLFFPAVYTEGYTDKELNISSLNLNKSWTEMENFRSKYLVVRLIFNNFEHTKLLTNYLVDFSNLSIR